VLQLLLCLHAFFLSQETACNASGGRRRALCRSNHARPFFRRPLKFSAPLSPPPTPLLNGARHVSRRKSYDQINVRGGAWHLYLLRARWAGAGGRATSMQHTNYLACATFSWNKPASSRLFILNAQQI